AHSSPEARRDVERRLRARLARDRRDRGARLALGLLARDAGAPEAEGMLREAAAEMHRAGDARGEVDALRALVTVLLTEQRLEEAEEALAAANRAAEASGDADLQAAMKVLASAPPRVRSQHDRAWAMLKEVEPTVFPKGA